MCLAFATLRGSRTGWSAGRLRIPYSAPALALLAAGALAGFPLDDIWHALYGIDVTMWSPTHLLMIGAASLATIAIWLVLAEARAGGPPGRPLLWASWGGTALVGLSTFQLEYDMGIPQWQLVFQPLLVAAAAGIVLMAARAAAGRGGALAAVALFLLLRGAALLLIEFGFGHTPPRVPLYLGEAAVVEVLFWLLAGRARPWQLAVACGLGIGTIGLGVETAWINAWFPNQWTAALLPTAWQAMLVAVAGAFVGLALGGVLAGGRLDLLPAAVPLAGLAVIALVLGYHVLARHPAPDTITVSTQPAGPVEPLRTHDGGMNPGAPVRLEVGISPAPPPGDQVVAVAWQGHQPVVHHRLVEVAPGVYRADEPLPTGGDWKSIAVYGRGDVLDAVPISMPADAAYRLSPDEAPVEPRTARAVGTADVLMREFHGGSSRFGLAVYAVFLGFVAAWVASLALAARQIGRRPSVSSSARAAA
jgi:hypothetical protein